MPGPETKSKDEVWKLPIKLGAAMLKHYAAKAVGEEAVKLVVEQALDSSKDGSIAKIDEWLKSSKAKKAVEKALEQAAGQFGKSAPAQALTAAGFVWRNTAGVKKAVE